MRLAAVPAAAVRAALDDPRRIRHTHPAPLADLGPRLPAPLVDRLTGLLAQDPGLAEAVSARLPAARAESARDLAAYAPATPASTIDFRS